MKGPEVSAPPQTHPYAAFLDKVTKPARYVGGEVGSRVRAWEPSVAKVCLAFPDVYDIGMSHLGFKILYGILNDDPRTLAERCYTPWIDLEAELRARSIPLVSLESKRPLKDFDVVGFSLQFELTFTNILTMLDLGGIPLRAEQRGEQDPLVIAGGPVATHPEPIAPFLDAIVIGDGEESATLVALTWKRCTDAGMPRKDRLRELAKLGGVYVPSLYETELEPATGLLVVKRPEDPTLPFPIERSLVDLAKYPFPDESPAGGPEAIFDRMSIEIARGCTEGCRFCQAGMIYRPVRERDPEQIVDTVMRSIDKSGQDEVSLTALSTADVSCIAPLIKRVSERLADRKVSLGVSSLRAYGLEPELLDELRRVRGTGLTFAPEAGTQRMRDVINKNVTEEQLLETAERVFGKGWTKMKLYFICGLPTETDEDVLGIIETGKRALAVGRKAAQPKGNAVEVTVSVSVHVPKPHTPFQWAALDDADTIAHKQRLLRDEARKVRGIKLKTHDAGASKLEGAFARGDRRLGDVLEHAYRAGARFDSWEDQIHLNLWRDAFDAYGLDPVAMTGTLPVSARLPWSHIDVGLEDGFLAREYRRALQGRLSPPCGKVAGAFVHETTPEAARQQTRRLVCYDCGVACDMTKMREDRIESLEKLERVRLPIVPVAPAPDAGVRAAVPPTRYRFWFEKLGPVALIGHLDLIREIPRAFRRAGLTMAYSGGFHPKPEMVFAPALSLGVSSLDEALDVKLVEDVSGAALDEALRKMNTCVPAGLRFIRAERLTPSDAPLSKVVRGARYAIVLSRSALSSVIGSEEANAFLARRCDQVLALPELRVRRSVGDLAKMVDVRSFIERAEPLDATMLATIRDKGLVGDLVGFDVRAIITSAGAAKPSEIASALLGEVELYAQLVRLALILGPPSPKEPVQLDQVTAQP